MADSVLSHLADAWTTGRVGEQPLQALRLTKQVPPQLYQRATLYTESSLDPASPVGRCLSCNKLPSACKLWSSSSLRVPDTSNRLISVWSVRCRGGAANAMLRVDISGKLLLHVAARLRFSKIRQQINAVRDSSERSSGPVILRLRRMRGGYYIRDREVWETCAPMPERDDNRRETRLNPAV